ncbi:MAG: winged helix-turn-helix domain-containing protein [Armatimonadota bacterium]
MLGSTLLIMSPNEIRDTVAAGLRDRRIDVRLAEGVAGLGDGSDRADVAVVELGLAGSDGAQVCAELRNDGPAGLIVLGDGRVDVDAADVLRAGADDFMSHPVSASELVARVRALLRRLREYCEISPGLIDIGEVTMRCDRHEVMVRGEPVALTPKEFDLLRELARGAGNLVEREALLERIWGYDESISTRTLDVHVGRLRKKIERDPSSPRLILTVPRLGYRIAA